MFEKEAEEYRIKAFATDKDYESIATHWRNGAEFGYNKAKDDADEMKSRFLELCNLKDMRIKELEKANEWHYVKDELPEKEKYVLVYTKLVNVYMARLVKNNYFINKNGGFVQTSSVIAWKEIVLPELKENE